MAKRLSDPKFKPKVVKPKKGKGSYSRKAKPFHEVWGQNKVKGKRGWKLHKAGFEKTYFNRIKAGGKGGAPGQWSARKAQMMASAIKAGAAIKTNGKETRPKSRNR